MNNTKIILTNILWKKHPENERYYFVNENDEIILLRINNFPDEPLYTLINGFDITDIEDKPVGWSLENS